MLWHYSLCPDGAHLPTGGCASCGVFSYRAPGVGVERCIECPAHEQQGFGAVCAHENAQGARCRIRIPAFDASCKVLPDRARRSAWLRNHAWSVLSLALTSSPLMKKSGKGPSSGLGTQQRTFDNSTNNCNDAILSIWWSHANGLATDVSGATIMAM